MWTMVAPAASALSPHEAATQATRLPITSTSPWKGPPGRAIVPVRRKRSPAPATISGRGETAGMTVSYRISSGGGAPAQEVAAGSPIRVGSDRRALGSGERKTWCGAGPPLHSSWNCPPDDPC